MRLDTASALASSSSTMPARIRLAARRVCRLRRLLAGRSTTGLMRLGLALPSLLHEFQEAVAEEIEMVMQSRAATRNKKRKRGEDHEVEGEEEEEVEVDEEAEAEPHHDENALMQSRRPGEGRPTLKEEVWRPISTTEKNRIVEVVKALMETQTSAEPSLTVLAYLEEPVLHGCGEASADEPDLEVSMGELRPALIR